MREPAVRPFIEIRGVCRTFVTPKATTEAVRDVTLEVGEGEFVSLIGPSGCGKSTLLKIVGDILPPTRGEVRIDGRTPQDARRDRAFGFVFQDPTLLFWRNVLDNVRLPLEVIGVDPKEGSETARELLNLVGLPGFEKHYPDEISGGMQQRVSIARALSFNPSILLMDEPFGALDLITRDRMNRELLDIWQKTRKTILFVTHSIAEAIFLSDRVAVMSPSPGRLADVVTIDLPRPREIEMRETVEFMGYSRRLRTQLG